MLADQAALVAPLEDLDSKLTVLREAWDAAFPATDYPYQRLTREGGRKLLANGRELSSVVSAIKDSPLQAKEKIQSPLAYVLASLQSAERKQARQNETTEDAGEVVITDDVRRLTERGRRLFGEKD